VTVVEAIENGIIKSVDDLNKKLATFAPGAHVEGDTIIMADGSGLGHMPMRAFVMVLALLFLAFAQFLFANDLIIGRLVRNLLLIGAVWGSWITIKAISGYFQMKQRIKLLEGYDGE